MRKFTLLIASLFFTIGAMAQLEAGTEYRIKEKSTGKYLSVGGTAANSYGEVYGAGKIEDDAKQIFTFEVANEGTYYVKSNSGEYISYEGTGAGWNVNADPSITNAHELTFEETANTGEFKIKGYNTSKGANKYFKWEYVGASGKYHPFNDADAGATFIVEKVAAEVYTIVYKYIHEGNVVLTNSYEVTEGGAYPDLLSGLYGVTVNGTKPTGTVSGNGEYVYEVTYGEMPFEYYEDYTAVEEANGWYNLIMHSNWNTGDGTAKYRTYLSHNEGGTTLAWGTERSLTNPSDAHYWAFVGNPINGFRVVNKATGAEKVLSSNGTTNPLMIATEGMADGYNTTWQIADRKYDVSTEGDYIREGAWFCLKHPGSNNYINANAGNGNVAFWNDNDNGSGILAVKPLTINAEADLATFYTDNYVKMPSTLGAEVYYATEVVNSNYIHLELISGEVIPAQTGVVVKYAVENNVVYAPEITSQGTTTAVTGNLLKGTTKRTLISKDANKSYYVLGMTDGVGFYNAVNGANEDEFYNGAFKAYLELPAAQGTAAFYGFDWDGTTGIDEITDNREQSTVIYDLTGRRIDAITAPGIYIVNGVKRLVK